MVPENPQKKMNTQTKSRLAEVIIPGVLATLAGCANSPLRQSTSDAFDTPIHASMVAENVEPPVPLQTVTPRYPDTMKRSGIPGTVNVNCLVDENGRVKEAAVANSTDRAFNDSSLEALWKWTFKPGERDGVAVPMRVNVPVRFTIADM
jgi:TonB family protein